MMSSSNSKITDLLSSVREGDRHAIDQVFVLVQDDLRRLARKHLRGERKDHTLDTSALVHESYINMVEKTAYPFEDRSHFLAIASRAMRHILIDYARKRNALKRGGGAVHLSVDEIEISKHDPSERLLALDEALNKLAEIDPRMSLIVECRYFAGMTVDETAHALTLSKRTVERCWTKAKAYLKASFL